MSEFEQTLEQPASAPTEPAPADYTPADITRDFSPMERAAAVPESDDEPTFGGDRDGIRQAADELVQQRSSLEREIIERDYRDYTGKHIPLDKFVKVEDAASDLANIRKAEAEAIEAARNAEVADAVDQMHAGVQEQPAPEPTPQLEAQPEAAPEQPAAAETKLQRMLREDPEFRTEIERVVQNVETHKQEAAAKYEAAAAATVQQLNAWVAAMIPELSGATNQQEAKGRLDLIRTQNPARYSEIVNTYQRAQIAMADQAAYVQQQQIAAQHHAQEQQAVRARQFQEYAVSQDNAFDMMVANDRDALKEVQSHLPSVLEKRYGLSAKELTRLYNEVPFVRHAGVQRLIFDAVRFSLASASLPRALTRPVASVQKPGTVEGIPRPSDDYSAAAEAFRANPSARAGAALIAQRRANRSR